MSKILDARFYRTLEQAIKSANPSDDNFAIVENVATQYISDLKFPSFISNRAVQQYMAKAFGYLGMVKEAEQLIHSHSMLLKNNCKTGFLEGLRDADRMENLEKALKVLSAIEDKKLRTWIANMSLSSGIVTIIINNRLIPLSNDIHDIMKTKHTTFEESKDAGMIAYNLKHHHTLFDNRAKKLAEQVANSSKEDLNKILTTERDRFFSSPKKKDQKYVHFIEKQINTLKR